MGCDFGLEATSITHSLDYTCHKGRAVKLVHFLGDTDVSVDKWVIICNHIFVRRVR